MKEAVIRITEGAKEGTIKVSIEFVGGTMDMDAIPHLAAIEMVNHLKEDSKGINAKAKARAEKAMEEEVIH